jgi:GntR family transcriptional regulator, vanillate catabolism transcriptional regulator
MSKRSAPRATTGPRRAAVTLPQARRKAHGGKPAVPAATLAQTVAERLRVAVLGGRFAPDEKLHEESLAAMLQVSRTPVRSALHGLAAEGLLDYVPNRGYSVRGVDLAGLSSIFDVRGVLEGLAARLAAERGMNEQVQAAYRQALAEGDRVMAKGRLLVADRATFSDVNARIHTAILEAAGNRMLHDMIRLCHNIPTASDRHVPWDEYLWLRRSHDDHHRMFDAIVLRDGPRAEQLMREHIHTVKLRLGTGLRPVAGAVVPQPARKKVRPGASVKSQR